MDLHDRLTGVGGLEFIELRNHARESTELGIGVFAGKRETDTIRIQVRVMIVDVEDVEGEIALGLGAFTLLRGIGEHLDDLDTRHTIRQEAHPVRLAVGVGCTAERIEVEVVEENRVGDRRAETTLPLRRGKEEVDDGVVTQTLLIEVQPVRQPLHVRDASEDGQIRPFDATDLLVDGISDRRLLRRLFRRRRLDWRDSQGGCSRHRRQRHGRQLPTLSRSAHERSFCSIQRSYHGAVGERSATDQN